MHRPPCYAKKLWSGRRSNERDSASHRREMHLPFSLSLSFSPGNALLHNVPAPHEHLSMPITDFGKGARRGFAFFLDLAVFVRNPCRADAIVATHGGNLLESPIVLCRMVAPKLPRIEPLGSDFIVARLVRRACREFSEQLSALFYGHRSWTVRFLVEFG